MLATCLVSSVPANDNTRIEVKLGYTRDYTKLTEAKYYDIKLFGHKLANQGSEPTFTDYAQGGLADVSDRGLFLSVERGLTNLGGSLLKGFSAQPLERFNKELKDFNFVFGVDAQLESLQNTVYTAGLEYRPIFPFARVDAVPIVGFFAMGASGQRTIDQAGNRNDQFQGTLRGGVAKTFYWSKGSAIREVSKEFRDINYVREHLSEVDTNKEPFKSIAARYVRVRDELKKDDPSREPTQDEWNRALQQEFFTQIPDEPDLTLWVDFNARYALSDVSGARHRAIWSANARYVLNPGQDKTLYIQAQYVNGFSEASASARTNCFILSLGFRF